MFNLLTLILAEAPAKGPQPTPVQSASVSTLSGPVSTPLPSPVAAPEAEAPAMSPQSSLNGSAQRLLDGSLRVEQTQSLPTWQTPPDFTADRKIDDQVQLETSANPPASPLESSSQATVGPQTGSATAAVAPRSAQPTTSIATSPSTSVDVNQRFSRPAVPPLSSPTAGEAAVAPPSGSAAESGLETRKRDRQKVIEARLAEIVARDRIAKDPRFQETQVTTAIDYANQGEFAQARKIIETSAVPQPVRANLLAKINVLEKANTARTLGAGQLPSSRQLAMRKGMQAPLADRREGSAGNSSEAYSTGAAPKALSRFDLGVVNPEMANALAYYNGTPPAGFNNGDQQIVYPLPVPVQVTSPFGWRRHPISGTRRFHSGTDLGAEQGTPVVAAYSGRIKGADYMGGYGLAIVVEHQNGSLKTLYAHLSKATVRPGEWVEQGTIIGAVGSTGASTGPHLHFEMRKLASDGWTTMDPGPQLSLARDQLVRLSQRAQRARPASEG
jgi:murein DD-endopeptidase MepM/ murein hydrolase activator NlpD